MARTRANEKKHTSMCKVCKSQYRKAREALFYKRRPCTEIAAQFPDITRQNIESHCRFFGLYEKRSEKILDVCDVIIDYGLNHLHKIQVNLGNIVKAAELKGKITGELVEKQEHKHTGEVKTTHDVSDRVAKQMDNLIKKLGGLPDGISKEDISESVS